MRTVIFDALEKHKDIREAITDIFRDTEDELDYFKLEDMHILPCRCCGVCGHKTPGKCVVKDDMPLLLKAFASSDVIVMMTPIRFGGYSAQLKKVVDKLALVGLPFYFVKKGCLLHPMRYGSKTLILVGVKEKETQGQEENFELLVENNAWNMLSTARTLILHQKDDLLAVKAGVDSVIKEVYF